jgi:ribosome-binding protein aMBF1 (putative translation factor)
MSTVDEPPKDLILLHREIKSPPFSKAARIEENVMDEHTRKAIEDVGFRVTTVRQFLGLSEEENELVELRVAISRAIRAKRESVGLSQSQLAERVGSSQPRVARIEAAAPGVSLDLMFRSFFALGGTFRDLATSIQDGSRRRRRTSGARRRRSTQAKTKVN